MGHNVDLAEGHAKKLVVQVDREMDNAQELRSYKSIPVG